MSQVFHRLSKHLEFRQKYSGPRCNFNSLFSVLAILMKLFLAYLIYHFNVMVNFQ